MNSNELKTCCAAAYESDLAKLLLGESFHPGGLELTTRLGTLAGLAPGKRVLDAASGKGATAIHLARQFGCEVTGLDLGDANVRAAREAADAAGLSDRVLFQHGDAEHLPFSDAAFDAVVCECAYCTFPNKPAAAAEFFRVLRPGGRLGMSDLTRAGALPRELEGLLAWISCIADARPVDEYLGLFGAAGFADPFVEEHNHALGQMVRDIQGRLLGAELMVKLKKIDLGGVDFQDAKTTAQAAARAVQNGLLGYSIILATRP